jgi:CTD nuclear envelope phosphatase 1
MINEEGLPIHEIREDENGKLLNDLPVSEAEVEIKVDKEEKEDFWSKEAVARREALRRKVFDDPSDSEDDSEDEPSAREAVPSPSIIATPPTPSTQTTNPIPEPTRRTSSSSSTLQPKSILKSSTPRKKSVSFDSSVPVPPDSPGPSTTKIGGSMFPNPVINIETGIQERAVPVLNAPKRSPNRATFEEPFAGFKSGFLGGSTNKGKVDPPSPVNLTSEPSSMETPAESAGQSKSKLVEPKPVAQAQAEPKMTSLFAQRQSNPASTESAPTFPAMSTSTHTSSVKNEIIERPSPAPTPSQAGPSRIPSKDRITGKTAGVASTVTERSEPIAGPSRLTSHLPPNDDHDEGYDDEEDDEDDDDSFYADDDDDEYDLDDALLAREVALAYHQNRAYSLLGQQNARSTRSSEDNPEGYDESYVDGYGSEGEGEEGGVMLGIPQISMMNEGGMPSIVNPTPDDLRRFVRVGKLDNGKLVLAPGEDGWSDEDEGRDVKQEKNREEIKAALLGKGGPTVPKVQEKRRGDEAIGMPPVIESAGAMPVQSAVKEKNITTPVVQKEVADPPKKVSRFKAARMG